MRVSCFEKFLFMWISYGEENDIIVQHVHAIDIKYHPGGPTIRLVHHLIDNKMCWIQCCLWRIHSINNNNNNNNNRHASWFAPEYVEYMGYVTMWVCVLYDDLASIKCIQRWSCTVFTIIIIYAHARSGDIIWKMENERITSEGKRHIIELHFRRFVFCHLRRQQQQQTRANECTSSMPILVDQTNFLPEKPECCEK